MTRPSTTRPLRHRPTPTPESISGPVTVGVSPSVPEEWTAPLLAILNATGEVQTAGGAQPLTVLDQPDIAQAQAVLLSAPEANHPLATRVLAAVAPFATVRDDVSYAELQGRWRDPAAGGLLVTDEAARWLSGLWGAKAPGVEIVSAADMDTRLEGTPGAVGIVAFEQLDPRMKALTVDGFNVLSNTFQANTYPLAVTLSVMIWLGVPHAPAGATTLIVALGLLRTPSQLVILMAAVVILILQGIAINRLAGIPYPLWKPAPK